MTRRAVPRANRSAFANVALANSELVVDERGLPWFGDGSRPGGVSHRATDDGNTFDRAIFDRLRDQAVSINDGYLPTDPDFTAAANRVLASGKNLFLPSLDGGYPIHDAINMSSAGQQIITDGAYHGYFRATPNFNLSATGIVNILPAEGSYQAGLTNVGILCEQPAAPTSASQLVQYPWAINASDVSRLSFNGVIRIEDSWKGLKLDGNVGGLRADHFEVCAYNTAYEFDGALDTVHITTLKLWPFIASNTPEALALYSAGPGGFLGRIDGLDIKTLAHFAQPLLLDTTRGVSGIGSIGSLQLDGVGSNLTWNNHGYRVNNLYSTAALASKSAIIVSGGFFSVAGMYLQGNGRDASVANGVTGVLPIINQTGGQLQILNPFIHAIGPAQQVMQQNGGLLDWHGGIFNAFSDLTYDVPLMNILGGAATIKNPRFTPGSGSTNVAIKVATDNWHDIEVNAMMGWKRSVPASPTTSTFKFGSTLVGGPAL